MESKAEIRKYIWDTLESKKISNPNKSWYGRIPDFHGSDEAAGMLKNGREQELCFQARTQHR